MLRMGTRQRVGVKFKDGIEFLKGWNRNRKSVGTTTPTSTPTARKMASVIRTGSDSCFRAWTRNWHHHESHLGTWRPAAGFDLCRILSGVLRASEGAISRRRYPLRRRLCSRSGFGRAARLPVRLCNLGNPPASPTGGEPRRFGNRSARKDPRSVGPLFKSHTDYCHPSWRCPRVMRCVSSPSWHGTSRLRSCGFIARRSDKRKGRNRSLVQYEFIFTYFR